MNEQKIEKWVNTEELMEHLGVNRGTIRNLIKNKNMPAYKIGGSLRFKISEVDEWIINSNK